MEFADEIDVVRTFQKPQPAAPLPKPDRLSRKVEVGFQLISPADPITIDTTLNFDPAEPFDDPVFVQKSVAPPPKPVIQEVEAPLIIAEVMPRFPGCEDQGMSKEERKTCADKKLLEYIYEHIDYPQAALQNDISGMIVVQFVVEKDGSITGAEVLKEIGGGCGREVLRVIDSMPNWVPGSQQGRKVRVMFRLPVRFEPSR